jgi:hypothetical protein
MKGVYNPTIFEKDGGKGRMVNDGILNSSLGDWCCATKYIYNYLITG